MKQFLKSEITGFTLSLRLPEDKHCPWQDNTQLPNQ
jgi:hypothetical protein